MDWNMVNLSCKRFRELGRGPFFSQKVMIMTTAFLRRIVSWQATSFAPETIQIARNNIRRVILCISPQDLEDPLPSPISFFPRLTESEYHILMYNEYRPIFYGLAHNVV